MPCDARVKMQEGLQAAELAANENNNPIRLPGPIVPRKREHITFMWLR